MYDSEWLHRNQARVISPAAAIRKIAAGRRILIGSGAAEPVTLVNALVEHGAHLADNDVVHLLTLGPAPYVRAEFQARFRHTAFFIGSNTREAVQAGRADFMPIFLSEIPRLIRSRRLRVDVVLLQVTPPDRHGQMSLGISVDVMRAAVDSADLVIAEVNPLMPRTFGDSMIRVDDVDWLVPVETPILEHPLEPLDEVSVAIGRHVASLIPNGATLQTGIGKLPHAVMCALHQREDLGIHTEMLSDSVLELIEAGVITGRKKTLMRGKIVTSFVMGTKRLYDFVHDNPCVELWPSDFTNDPLVIAQNENMVAINSALAVDLTGQVAADTLGGRFFSGIGGQVDFIRGAARSSGGKPIICMPSTADDGRLSRIQATLEAGAGVVTSRGDVHYVVTEYGIADLWGKTIRQRATALIEIAHPDFRRELMDAAKARSYVFTDQRVPRAVSSARGSEFALKNGEQLWLRPVVMADEDRLQALLYRLSEDASYQRFFCHKGRHSHAELQAMLDVDQIGTAGLVAETKIGELVAFARYDLDLATGFADIAFVVLDAYQGQGLGRALFNGLVALALASDVRGFTAEVLVNNAPMLAIFGRSGFSVETRLDSGVYHVRLALGARAPRRPSAQPEARIH